MVRQILVLTSIHKRPVSYSQSTKLSASRSGSGTQGYLYICLCSTTVARWVHKHKLTTKRYAGDLERYGGDGHEC